MNKATHLRLFSVALILAFASSALFVFVVSADDSTPPTDPTPTADSASTSDTAATVDPTPDPTLDKAPVADTTVVDEVTTTGEAAPTQDPVATEDTTSTDTAQLISDLPENTDLVVLDAEGNAVPLTSSDAADIIATGDPMWCPVGVTPGSATCTSFGITTFNGGGGLISFLSGKTVAGVIWIEASYTSGSEGGIVTIDGGSLGTTKDYALILQGGWSGNPDTLTNPATPSRFQVPLSVVNWNANVTLNDIEVYGVAGGNTCNGGPLATMCITTTKNIALNRVHVHDSTGSFQEGAKLDNTISSGTGNVTVSSSEFTGNDSYNLDVVSNGSITLNNVIASGSANNGGAALSNAGVVGKPVTVTGTNAFDSISLPSGYTQNDFFNTFNFNFGGPGLYVASQGVITVNNIIASGNFASGAELNNCGASFPPCTYSTSAGVNVTGTNFFDGNTGDGLLIVSRGAVKVNSVTANANFYGVVIYNQGAASAQPVTFTGSNAFKYNLHTGLFIYSNGQITLNNVIAYSNSGILETAFLHDGGVQLNNTYGAGGVTFTGTNEFTGNYNNGLYIQSNGAVSLTNITANRNGTVSGSGYALYVDNSTSGIPKSVTISGTNKMDHNQRGVYITSKGVITVSNLSVTYSSDTDGDGLGGAYFKNDNAGAVGGVTLTGTNTFTSNYSGAGLKIRTFGAITLSNVTASSNGTIGTMQSGIDLDNSGGSAGVTISGTNIAIYNGVNGVIILSKGTISINSLNASSNGSSTAGYGLDIDNTTGTGAVKLTGTNNFNYNVSGGLRINSKGAISLNSVFAQNNNFSTAGIIGADLDNCQDSGGCTAPGNPGVTITGTNSFYYNGGTGLKILTGGAISLNNVTATYALHGADGADLDNTKGGVAKTVTITGSNYFNYNTGSGLWIDSLGAINISATTIQAYGNTGGFGARLDNCQVSGSACTSSAQPVTVSSTSTSGSYFSYNSTNTGLKIITSGAIKINNITAYSNGNGNDEFGMFLDNCIDVLGSCTNVAQPVTLSGNNGAGNNFDSGVRIHTLGLITISTLYASNNGLTLGEGYGLEIPSTYVNKGVKQTGTLYAYNNYSGGLLIYSGGPVSLNNVTAGGSNYGSSKGAVINNIASTTLTPQNVTFTGENFFNYNASTGLDIITYGAITLSKISASNSYGGSGAVLDNSGADPGLPKAVMITGISSRLNIFQFNNQNGLVITSRGQITLSYMYVQNNTNGLGASLDNSSGNGGVTLSGDNSFRNNGKDTGLKIVSHGAILINNLIASNNGDGAGEYGAYLDNSGGSLKAVTLTGSSTLNTNKAGGLYIKSTGLVTLNQITANSNGLTLLQGYGVEITDSAATAGVKLTGSNTFNYNYTGGIKATSAGPITLNNLNIYNNSSAPVAVGAVINNQASGSGSGQNVALTGTNYLSNNYGSGLQIDSYGTISINNLTVAGVYSVSGIGIDLDNTGGSAPKNITFTGTNRFYDNLEGLIVKSSGGIIAAGLQSYSNSVNGATLTAAGNVTLNGSQYFGSNAAGWGLKVESSGAILINNLDADTNGDGVGDYGAYLYNLGGSAGVTLTGSNYLAYNYDAGLFIRSNGPVTLSNLDVESNDYSGTASVYGADIDNSTGPGSGTSGVTISGTNLFSSNADQGLHINSLGAITLNNITATSNGSTPGEVGASITNATDGKGVTLTGTNVFTYNGDGGLLISSHGVISINNLKAENNFGTSPGASLDNSCGGTCPAVAVNLTGTNSASENNGPGLEVKSQGVITINSLTAWNNNGFGTKLDNSYGTGTFGVTLAGTNKFWENGIGLQIVSDGKVTLANIVADNNGAEGVMINTTGDVLISCADLYGDGSYDLQILNADNVTLKRVIDADEDLSGISGTLTRVRTCP